jgi:undecaprenyl-diphosphatase
VDRREDKAVSDWVVTQRTPTLDTLTRYGSLMSETGTCIALTAVLVLVLRWWLGRWRESIAVLVAILGELFVFLLVTNTVGRPRPDVFRLTWRRRPRASRLGTRPRRSRSTVAGPGAAAPAVEPARRADAGPAVLCVPVIVAISRVYRGMHYLTDVTFGMLGGGTWLLITALVVLPRATYGRRGAAA